MDKSITSTLAKFSCGLNYKDLPENVVHEIKRGFLDTVGCAIGGIGVKKGRLSIQFARNMGGKPEATILGTGDKVPRPMAAFVNGDTMHALDYTALLPPGHVAPYVTSAVLAIAEGKKTSGKDLITALAVAHENASRIGVSLGGFRLKNGAYARVFGMSNNVFGAAAGAARIMNLDEDKMADAFGLAGYFAPLPSHQKFLYTTHNGMQKYGPSGWIAQAGTTAALLAQAGERGDRTVLDGEYGFWAMTSAQECNWDMMTRNLGKEWFLLQAKYKSFPCCGAMQSPLGALTKLVIDNDLKPEEIQQLLVKSDAISALPQFVKTEIYDHFDAQNSLYYNMSVVVHRIKVGPVWQMESTLENPSIIAFMKKVKHEPYAKAIESSYQELSVEGKNYINRRPSRVEATARGKVFVQETEYARWLSAETPGFRATDEDLKEKFRGNTENVLSPAKIKEAIDTIMNLENVSDINQCIKLLVP